MECKIASTETERSDVLRQRYDVFVEEFHFLAPREDGQKIEYDPYDDHALWVGVWEEGTLIASCRLILPNKALGLPTLKDMTIDPSKLPERPTAEISRITVANGHRTFKKTVKVLQAMQKEIASVSSKHGVSQWVGAVEPGFLRLLNFSHLPYSPIGPLQYRIGTERYPVMLTADDYSASLKEHP